MGIWLIKYMADGHYETKYLPAEGRKLMVDGY